MTKEEAKKIGATHLDISGDAWRVISDNEAYFYDTLFGRWVRCVFNHNKDIESGYIKPL